MKKQLLIIAALTASIYASAQTTKTDLAANNLKGKVKSANEIVYEGEEKFGEFVKGAKTDRYYREFNKVGMETQYLQENYDDGEKEQFVRTTRYENDKLVESKEEAGGEVGLARLKYNQDGLLESIDILGAKGGLMRRQKNKYNADGLLTQSDSYEANGSLTERTVSSYNAKKQLAKEEVYNSAGDKTALHTYVYDNRGNMVEKSSTNYEKKDPKPYVCRYAYNDRGQKIEERNSIAGLDKKYTYEYGAHGDEVRREDRYGWEEKNTYVYDAQNNWTKRITTKTTSSGKTTHEITERQIKYY